MGDPDRAGARLLLEDQELRVEQAAVTIKKPNTQGVVDGVMQLQPPAFGEEDAILVAISAK